jgi:hypothetical protein
VRTIHSSLQSGSRYSWAPMIAIFYCWLWSLVTLGTPVDCVSLALSGRLFPWSAPALVPCLFIL